MSLSINPVDIVKIFRERGIYKRKVIADYLNIIAGAATQLAYTWSGIYEKWLLSPGDKRQPLRDVLLGKQIPIFYEVSEHYKRASSVLGNILDKPQMSELFEALGALLRARDRTRTLFEIVDEQNNLAYLIESGERVVDAMTMSEIQDNIDSLHEEAATLRALAAAIQAQ
jgi:hypothetical protein